MANIHTISKRALVKRSINTAITAAANNGTGIDCAGFDRALVIFDSAPSGAGTTSDCKLQESSDNGSTDAYADVTSATFAQVTTAGGAKVQVMDVDLTKRERYIRPVHTGAGASAAGQAFVCVVLMRGRHLPPTQDNTVVSV